MANEKHMAVLLLSIIESIQPSAQQEIKTLIRLANLSSYTKKEKRFLIHLYVRYYPFIYALIYDKNNVGQLSLIQDIVFNYFKYRIKFLDENKFISSLDMINEEIVYLNKNYTREEKIEVLYNKYTNFLKRTFIDSINFNIE